MNNPLLLKNFPYSSSLQNQLFYPFEGLGGLFAAEYTQAAEGEGFHLIFARIYDDGGDKGYILFDQPGKVF